MPARVVQRLKSLWTAWKRIGKKIADFQARILLTIIFFVLVMPFGLVTRFFADRLYMKKRPVRWFERKPETHDMAWAQKQ
ncbi:MAG TPA: hypothetical protein VKB47_16650 [Terracidiphilus sp.]|nr:hypothetical protein [Terracidiphilus sp.]